MISAQTGNTGWPPHLVLAPIALPRGPGASRELQICLVVQAESRVPDAADLRSELSFPRQKMGKGSWECGNPKSIASCSPQLPELK